MVYYILEIEDIIKKGDQQFNPEINDWVEVHESLIGEKFIKSHYPIKRIIRIPSPTKPCFNCGYDGQDFMYDRTCPACMEEGV